MVEPATDHDTVEIDAPEPGPRLALSIREAAAAVGISDRLLRSLTNSKAVPHVKFGRRTLYPIRELENWLGLLAVDSVNPDSPTVQLLVDRTKVSLVRSRETLRELLMRSDEARGTLSRKAAIR